MLANAASTLPADPCPTLFKGGSFTVVLPLKLQA